MYPGKLRCTYTNIFINVQMNFISNYVIQKAKMTQMFILSKRRSLSKMWHIYTIQYY